MPIPQSLKKEVMLILRDISYTHPDKTLLFDHINLSVDQHEKTALIGNNGCGKSTLLKMIAGELLPASGYLHTEAGPYYVPQIFGQYNHFTIAQALRAENKLGALKEIMAGNVTTENYTLLDDDWTIEERCKDALRHWQLPDLDLSQKLGTLSGGQKTKVFLAGMLVHQPELILLDEPSNHLDTNGRSLLYNFIQETQCALILVSHDRRLLNLIDRVCELTSAGIEVYGGNYDFYRAQKQAESHALHQDLQATEKALRNAREKERLALERQQRSDSRGKGKQEKAGVARIMMNTLRNKAENSTSKVKSVHAEKIDTIRHDLKALRSTLPESDRMKIGFDNSALHKGKILFNATDINYFNNSRRLWNGNLNFQVKSGERIAVKGLNGSGKTTLLKIISGDLQPQIGKVYKADNQSVYIDQDYSLVNSHLSIYQQASQFNDSGLHDYEIKIRLNWFLFNADDWNKSCDVLSGGEKMRLLLCCLTISGQSPDIIMLDEPTNNLDTQNVEILTTAINDYKGTLIVVSHDTYFLEQLKIVQTLELFQFG